MKYSSDIKPITYLKTKSADLMKQVTTSRRPVVITQNGEARAVIQDVKSYEEDRNTLLLLKLIAQGVMDIENGALVEQEALFQRISKSLKRN